MRQSVAGGGHIPLVEALETLVAPDLLDNIDGTPVFDRGVICLQTRADDLVWIGDASSKHLADCAERQEIQIGEMVLAASCNAPVVLELLIGHELDGAMADAE